MSMGRALPKCLALFFLATLAIQLALNAAAAQEGAAAGGELDTVSRLGHGRSRRESSAQQDLDRNGDGRAIAPGETLVLGELEGPGVVTHFWNTVGSRDPFAGRSLVLRIYWDGAERPSVEVPLGDFFGVGHGASATFHSRPVVVSSEGRSRSCFWRMPFARSAKFTVTNESAKYRCDSFYFYLDWQKLDQMPADAAYFHAQYRQATPAEPGDYTLLETEGRGQYVGTVLSVQQLRTGWFGEGDDRFYIDGEEYPSLRGTGTEDYFNDAWGFRRFYSPYFGVPLWEGYFQGDRVSAYRWHLPDPVTFEKSLRVTIEHKGSVFTDAGIQRGSFLERPDWLSSVAYWYQTPARELDASLPPVGERTAPYRVLEVPELTVRAKPSVLLLKQKDSVAYMPRTEKAEIEFDFEVTEAGRYQVNAMIVHSLFGARYQALLDGEPVGQELDLCRDGLDPLWVSFDLHDLEPGKHTLRFEGRGPSPKSRSLAPKFFAFGLQQLVLLRLQDMAGYEEKKK